MKITIFGVIGQEIRKLYLEDQSPKFSAAASPGSLLSVKVCGAYKKNISEIGIGVVDNMPIAEWATVIGEGL